MADINKVNVGGIDYNVQDATARTNANAALTELAYNETGNTASQAYSVVGTPINWEGTLYYTKTAVAKGATWAVGTNLTAATNLGKLVRNVKTYVGSDSKLHFVDLTGADTVLPFSGTTLDFLGFTLSCNSYPSGTCNVYFDCSNANTLTKMNFAQGSYGSPSACTFTIAGSTSEWNKDNNVKNMSLSFTQIYSGFPNGVVTLNKDISSYKTLRLQMSVTQIGSNNSLTGCNLWAK